jgi:hypothetical protein
MKNILLFESFIDSVNEAEKGLMHKMLKIKNDQEIGDVYKNGDELAKAMLQGVKNSKIVPAKDVRKKATSMLAFAANWPGKGGKTVFRKALTAIKTLDIPGVPLSDN